MNIFLGLLTLMFSSSVHWQDSTEEKAIAKIFSLPEVQTRNKYIDSVTNHKHGITIIVRKKPLHKQDYYWIQAGNNNEIRFEPIYNFYVYLPDLRVAYLDLLSNEAISLENWRRNNVDCRPLYINTILESRNYSQYFLVTKARVDNKEREIVIMNYNLYCYLKSVDKKFSDTAYYKAELKKRLNIREPVVMGKTDLYKMEGFYVNNDSSIAAIASRGRQYFINHFFYVSPQGTYGKLKDDVADGTAGQIIKILFEWNYFVGIVEGQLTIINKKFCER